MRSGPARRVLAGIAAMLVASAAAVVWSAGAVAAVTTRDGDSPSAVAVSAATVPATPLLSVRRVPDWLEATAAVAGLGPELKAALAPAGSSAIAHSCLLATQGGRTLFAWASTREVLPASNMKLLTATAVLQRLGASTELATTVTAPAGIHAGVVDGNLYLVGGGDPFLFTGAYDLMQDPPVPRYTPLVALAARVRAAGIRAVTGSVVGDESLFDTQRYVTGWKSLYAEEGDSGPLSALEVDNGFSLTPPYGAAAQPAAMAAGVFAGLLKADGIRVAGPATSGVSPPGAPVVASIHSAPLGQVVGAVVRVSDDTGAELLTKLLGRRISGVGTTAAGVAVTRATLAADGLPVSQLSAVDGSGLARQDHVTCELMDLDLRMEGDAGPLFAGLPVAGETGTLADRMNGTPAAGRLHAKTGTLDGVSALSGFVTPAAREAGDGPAVDQPIVFSMILNDLPDVWNVGMDVGNDVGEVLAAYPRHVPSIAAAVPIVGRGPP